MTQIPSRDSESSPVLYVVLEQGKRQVGKPVQAYRVAMQRAYDLAAAADPRRLSRKQLERISYDIVKIR